MDAKGKILSTMKNLAGQKGFHAVTTDELASACGISKRTIYQHFTGKDEIVDRVLDGLMAHVDRRTLEIASGPASPPEKLREIARTAGEVMRFLEPRIFSDLQRYYPHLWEKMDRFRSSRIERLKLIFIEGARQGYFREINPDVLTTAFLAAVRAVINPEFILSRAFSLPQALDAILEIFLHGITVKEVK